MKTNLLKSIFISLILLVGATNAWSAELKNGQYIYIKYGTGNWGAADAKFRFNWYWNVGDWCCYSNEEGRIPNDNGSYYAYAKTQNEYTRAVQILRFNSNFSSEWNYTKTVAVSSNTKNCITLTSSVSDNYTFSWSTYAPPMSTVTLANNGTSTVGGTGTSSDPYLIYTATSIKVKASGSKTVNDPDATIYYDFKQGTTSQQNGTGTTYSFTASSTPNTSYTINLDGYTKVSTTLSTKKPATALYFKTIAKTYTVTFNANGHGTAPAAQTVTEGSKATQPTAPTATGYTFGGWYTDQACSNGKEWNFNTTITANITLYAKWNPNTNTPYVVKHCKEDLNGNYPAELTETENLTGTTDSKVTPSVKSYEGFKAPSTQTVTIKADGSLVVTYKYTRNKHTLTWNLDGGDITGAGTAGEVAYGATLTAPTVEKDGHTFTGWSPAVPATMPDNNVTCTAQWEKNMYTVTYGVVGAANGTIALNKTSAIEGQNTQNLEHGTELTFTAEPNDGYQIQGWYSDETGKTPLGNSTANQYTINPLTGAASVFVAFEKIPANTFIVTFDANGGSGTMNSQSFTENVPQNLADNKFNRTGYTFTGWTTAADGTGTSYKDGQSVTLTTAGLTLYAQWTANQYTITLDGGTSGTNTVTVHYDNNDYSANPVNVPSIQGYAFMGYYVAENGSDFQVVDANGNWVANAHGYTDADGKWKNANNTTLYAHFQKAQIATLTLDRTQIDAGDNGYVIPSYTIAPTPAGTVVVTWQLQYSNGNSVNGHEPIIEGETVKFSVDGLAAGAYKVVATLHLGDSNGEVLHTQEVGFVIVGAYTVTVKYMFENDEIAARTTHAGHPINPNSITAPEIGGYNFVKWVLGDGISSTSTLTDKTIEYLAAYDGYLTATYEKKELIFLDLSKQFGQTVWTAPHIYLYSAEFWDDNKGTGATTNCVAKGAMSPVPGTTGMWFYEYKDVKNFNGYVAFTPTDKMTQANFYDTEVIHRGDFSIGTPVFVPAVGQTANIKNPSEGKNAQYYNKGHWTKYMGGTGYTLKIYNHKEKDGRKELMSVPFTGSSLYLPFTAVVDLEAGQTFGYKIVRDNDKWYKNDNDGSMTVNSHTNWPFVEDNSDGLACGIQTVAAGIHTFKLTLNATSGNFEVTVDYPVTVGDYRILYKDNTRTTYKPSDIKKAEELNPVTSFFIRPNSDPELKIQTATYISDGDVSWSTYANEIHFKPNDLWKSDNARFAAYFYKGNTTNVWKDLTKNGDIYTCEKPSGCTHVIFCRMNPDVKTNSFDKGNGKPLWNQTRDLTLPTDKKNFYTLEEGAWRGQIYLKPNSNWTADGARFAAYFFEKSGNNTTKEEWHSMFKEDDGTYWCDIPEGCSQVIFCRMNPNVQDNNWDKGDGKPFWGMQTNDLQIPTNSNDLYTITNGLDKPAGAWSCKSWSTINGSINELTEELEKKLGEIKGDIKDAPDAVYTIYLSENGASIEKVEPYTGNYYIRVDAAAGKWYDYKTNPDNLMTYSAFSERTELSQNEGNNVSEPFSHYKTAWCEAGSNVKFVIANDYSPCISDTLVQDKGNPLQNIDEHGNLNANKYGQDNESSTDDLIYNANIRFMWDRSTNKVSRAYVAAATDPSRKFLVLKADQEIHDADNKTLTDNEVIFEDTQNWMYETTVKVKPGTRIKLYACYPDVAPATAQYFRGKYADNDWSDENTSQLLGGTVEDWYDVRIIYDFKTNRLMTALISDFSIEKDLTIDADIMVVRSHHDDAQHITIASEGVELSGVKIVYGTLQFNRWILNNRANPQDLDVETCTRQDGNHRVFDEDVTNEHHAPLPLAEQKSLYERGLYFVSFPFDVHLSDVFGFGTYGTHWVISAYNGLRRAQRGYFMDNCVNDDCTNWDYIWDPSNFTMKANEGYLLSLDLDLMKYDNINFWKNNRATVELYFPSMADLQTITRTDYTMDALSDEHKCKINLNVNGDNPIANRTIKDSYWRCIGVPSFADYLESEEWTAQNEDIPYLYEWNTVDNSLNVRSTNGFKFRSTFAYLVQNGNAIQWNAVNTQQPSQIMAKQQAAAATNYEWNISLNSQDKQVDQTYIRLTNNENVTHEFDFNQDLVKEFNYGRADIYTMIGYEPVAANSMPIENIATSVPLGIDVEKAGEYTIAMPEGTTSVGVTLVDIETGQRTNLAAGMEYTVYLAKGKHNERFMIEISPVNNAPTDIDQLTGSDLNAEGVQKYIIDGKLIIRTAEGEVFDAQGHRL